MPANLSGKGRNSKGLRPFVFSGGAMFNVRLKVDQVGRHELGLTATLNQYGRGELLESLAEVRATAPPADRDGLGRWALSIPFEDYQGLRVTWPELSASDPITKSRAYKRFLRHPDSLPYRVRA
jgi:hypothetical protein